MLLELQPLFSTLWVIWFFLLFGGILIWTLKPRRREDWKRHGEMIFRDKENG